MPTLTKVEKKFFVDDGNNRGPMTMLRVRFHPRDPKLVASRADRRIAWFDLTAEADQEVKGRGKCVVGELVCPHEIGWVRGLDVHPGGKQLATGGSDRTLRVWAWKDGRPGEQPSHQVEAHGGWVEGVAYSPDGRFIATAGFDGLVKVWDSADLTLLQTLDGHKRYVDDVAWSSDGKWLISGGEDGQVIVRDTQSWQTPRTIEFGGTNNQSGQIPRSNAGNGHLVCSSQRTANRLHSATRPGSWSCTMSDKQRVTKTHSFNAQPQAPATRARRSRRAGAFGWALNILLVFCQTAHAADGGSGIIDDEITSANAGQALFLSYNSLLQKQVAAVAGQPRRTARETV